MKYQADKNRRVLSVKRITIFFSFYVLVNYPYVKQNKMIEDCDITNVIKLLALGLNKPVMKTTVRNTALADELIEVTFELIDNECQLLSRIVFKQLSPELNHLKCQKFNLVTISRLTCIQKPFWRLFESCRTELTFVFEYLKSNLKLHGIII